MKANEDFHHHVSLSHNSADKPRVRWLTARLLAAGRRVWFGDLKCNADRFPLNFVFLFSSNKADSLRFQFCTLQAARNL